MAVQPTGGRSVPLYVLIVFIVLFLASTTALVLLFVHQEELRTQAQTATAQYEDYIGRAGRRDPALERYLKLGQAAKPKQSAVAALLAERNQLAMMLSGSASDTPEAIRTQLDAMIAELPAQAAGLKDLAKVDLIGAMKRAVDVMNSLDRSLAAKTSEAEEWNNKNTLITKSYRQAGEQFQALADDLTKQLEGLKKQFADTKADYAQNLESIKNDVSTLVQSKLDTMQNTFTQHIDELEDVVQRNLELLIGSMRQLGPAELRVASTMTVDTLIKKADGHILDLAGDAIYIDVGADLGLTVGTRFIVYGPEDRDSMDPKIKAVIEVTDLGKLTGEARAILTRKADPIVRNDLISNLVYDRELKPRFFVAGNFDLDGDGSPDPNSEEAVKDIITKIGGTVADQLSAMVNVVVLGSPPAEPTAPPVGSDEQAQAEYEKARQRVRQFADLKNQIPALGTPTIGGDVFLKFCGYLTELK